MKKHSITASIFSASCAILGLTAVSMPASAVVGSKPVFTCLTVEDVADGKARVDFYYDRVSKNYRAVYSVSGYTGKEVHDLSVCATGRRAVAADQGTPLVCHDVSWNRSYSVETTIGGYAGVGDATVKYRDAAQGTTVLASLRCGVTR